MAIKIKSKITVFESGENDLDIQIGDKLEDLLEGDYTVYICDAKKNRSLSQLKYLFGVVLKTISHDTGIEVNDLYRIFEHKFAPKKVITFDGKEQIIQDLKKVSSKEMGRIIEDIIMYADMELNIKIPTIDELKQPKAQDIYVNAYNNQWIHK